MQPPTLPIHESDEEKVDEGGPEPAHHATRVSLASWFTSLYVWQRHFGINWEALGLIARGLGCKGMTGGGTCVPALMFVGFV